MRLALLCLGLTGCVAQVPLRGSSYQHMRDSEARVVLPVREQEAVEALSALLGERGFHRIDTRSLPRNVTYYIYKGPRRTVNDVRGGGGLIVFEGHELGSWFLARVIGGAPTTEILLIGKPTVDGTEICSDADQTWLEAQYWCRDTRVRADYRGADTMHGTEEAETVRGVLTTLKQRYPLPGAER
jgi:hypothetical protein